MFLTLINYDHLLFSHKPVNALIEQRPLFFIYLQILQGVVALNFHTLQVKTKIHSLLFNELILSFPSTIKTQICATCTNDYPYTPITRYQLRSYLLTGVPAFTSNQPRFATTNKVYQPFSMGSLSVADGQFCAL